MEVYAAKAWQMKRKEKVWASQVTLLGPWPCPSFPVFTAAHEEPGPQELLLIRVRKCIAPGLINQSAFVDTWSDENAIT